MAIESDSTCREDSQPLPNLPPEIIVEILSRLPVKPLLRFGCVCKSWRSLISNRKFAKTHLNLASTKADYTHHRLIVSSSYPRTGARSCSLYSILNEESDSAVQLDCPLKVHLRVTIWDYCEGLVLIGTKRKVFIWNPTTRKYKGLPNVEMLGHRFDWFGFGYDKCIDDYKVVGFFYNDFTSGFGLEVMVYALRTDSWKRIEDCPRCIPRGALGTFVNRALHWIHLSTSSESNDIIVSLDLVKETYGEVFEPEYRDGYRNDILLGVLNGCLCILCNYSGACFDIWLMKEYGIIDSWTKLVVISHLPNPSDCLYSTPLCILENGEILLNIATHLVWHNPKDGTFSNPDIHDWSTHFSVYPYVESLVLPDFDADSGVHWQHPY